ncbi:MAG: RNA polymerase sigma factor [Opitutus sp.]|nr:RNA polymerase sigma factor [Opitutus sp.]
MGAGAIGAVLGGGGRRSGDEQPVVDRMNARTAEPIKSTTREGRIFMRLRDAEPIRKVAVRRGVLGKEYIRIFSDKTSSGGSHPCSRSEPADSPDLGSLVRLAQQGDEAAQRTLVTSYQRRVAGFVYAITGRSDAVEDLSQMVFIKMIRALDRLHDVAQFEAWLFRLARNTCIDHLRRQKLRRIFTPFGDEHENIPEPPGGVDSEELDALRHALQQLPPKDRALLALAQEGRSQAEMAAATGTTIMAVKARLHRAREKLRKFYTPSHET